tara:strand:+ start:11925 stop:14348 length:2424 start_codon:yes stop_codon:yes gene_type:complete
MDLNQSKLTKTEWDFTELPVNDKEYEILKLIKEGFHNVNLIQNKNQSMICFLRLEPSESIMSNLYTSYFDKIVKKLIKTYDFEFTSKIFDKIQRINSVEKLKLDNFAKVVEDKKKLIFEYYLLYVCEKMMKYFYNDNIKKFNKYYYTLYNLNNLHIKHVNHKVKEFIDAVLLDYYVELDIDSLFLQASDLLEKNEMLLQFKDISLYDHQKQLFTLCKKSNPKLILYIAPTGTGKTISPIGLSEGYKIIFLCAARHVGLALARSAIFLKKKVAFAFGCHDVSDIRLHYFSASDYVKSEKTGQDIKYKNGQKKIDNSNGSNVEIMICDIKSYLCAMYYMCSFHDKDKIILYWDEPTITLDYVEHTYHNYISEIWKKNKIPNIVLSSATLPQESDLQETIQDFSARFQTNELSPVVSSIISHDCNKSISIINKNNEIEMPHLKYKDFTEFKNCVQHCKKYKTLLRYFDLNEVILFLHYIYNNNFINEGEFSIKSKYQEISDLTMNNIKLHYLDTMDKIEEKDWQQIFDNFKNQRKSKYDSTSYIATNDAHTLTDGPTLFLGNDVEKIAKFILQTSKIPEKTLNELVESIDYNNSIIEMIKQKENKLEDILGEDMEKEHKMQKEALSGDQKMLKKEIDDLTKLVKLVSLSDVFVPNKFDHIKKWCKKEKVTNEYTSSIEPKDVEKIMLLNISNNWKLLLLMGIGVFTNQHNQDYTEIMKQLAMEQRLYLIIGSTDYIYGTNYQFCHGYISKDLSDITQEKCIQALGRIGRNQINKEYSIRFRDDNLIDKIFQESSFNPEINNMNKLFTTEI